jgi:lysophospholipase L1-like esterase
MGHSFTIRNLFFALACFFSVSCDAQIQIIPVVSGASSQEVVIPTQAEATDYYDRLVAKGVTMSAPDFVIVNELVYYLKNTMGTDGVTSLWASLDAFRIPGRTEIEMRENLIKNSHHATITNNYGGSYTALVGYKGNGTNFSVNTGVNLSTTSVASQNNACFGILILDDKSGDNNQDGSGMNSGGTSGTLTHPKRNSAAGYDVNGVINGANSGAASGRTAISTRAWYHIQRSASTGSDIYVNGYFMSTNLGTSATPLNLNIIEFAASLNGTISSWSALTHGIFYVGSSNVNANKIIEITQKYYLHAHNNSTSSIHNRLICIGDSMTGDEDISFTGASVLSERARRCQDQLGLDWTTVQNGNSNRQIVLTTTGVPSLVALAPTEVMTGANTSFTKDVAELFIGTNDFGLSTSTSAATAKSNLDDVIADLRAEGKIVIITGIVARGGSPAVGFDTKRADFRTALMADYSVSTGITNVTSNAEATIFYIDTISDSRFADFNDTTYFQADDVHLTAVAYDILADEYIVPICELP